MGNKIIKIQIKSPYLHTTPMPWRWRYDLNRHFMLCIYCVWLCYSTRYRLYAQRSTIFKADIIKMFIKVCWIFFFKWLTHITHQLNQSSHWDKQRKRTVLFSFRFTCFLCYSLVARSGGLDVVQRLRFSLACCQCDIMNNQIAHDIERNASGMHDARSLIAESRKK